MFRRTQKSCGNIRLLLVFPTAFLVLLNFHLSNIMNGCKNKTKKRVFLFLKWNIVSSPSRTKRACLLLLLLLFLPIWLACSLLATGVMQMFFLLARKLAITVCVVFNCPFYNKFCLAESAGERPFLWGNKQQCRIAGKFTT